MKLRAAAAAVSMSLSLLGVFIAVLGITKSEAVPRAVLAVLMAAVIVLIVTGAELWVAVYRRE